MKFKYGYIIARGAYGRPTLQHRMASRGKTWCGKEVYGWSRAYQHEPIPQVFCKRCQKLMEK